mmetsp:Transcript_20515/g.19484  ORF Transcript_20515/g.19484 Transcript_20515/m.19484 type:complete len:175 (+) Transcript_20515:1-525(+)
MVLFADQLLKQQRRISTKQRNLSATKDLSNKQSMITTFHRSSAIGTNNNNGRSSTLTSTSSKTGRNGLNRKQRFKQYFKHYLNQSNNYQQVVDIQQRFKDQQEINKMKKLSFHEGQPLNYLVKGIGMTPKHNRLFNVTYTSGVFPLSGRTSTTGFQKNKISAQSSQNQLQKCVS